MSQEEMGGEATDGKPRGSKMRQMRQDEQVSRAEVGRGGGPRRRSEVEEGSLASGVVVVLSLGRLQR